MKGCRLLFIFLLFSFLTSAQNSLEKNDVSKQKVNSELKIKVFPNPASNVVNILGLLNSSQADITISDISGNVVLQHYWAIRNNAISIPVPNLDAGIYVVKIKSDEQKIQTKIYIK